MSEIRVTSVVGENGGDRVGLTTGLTVGPLTGTTGIGATITHQGHAQFAGVCTATSFVGSGANLTGVTAGLFSSYAIISDTKASNVNGGTFTSGAWRTRDLQTENADPDNIVSISSNQFTLQAGSYLIKFQSTGYHVNRHITRLRDITNSATKGYGILVYSNTSNSTSGISHGMARVTISGATVYEIQHACQTTKSTNGMGLNTYIDTSGSYTDNTEPNSVYTIVEIYKEN